MQIVDCFKDLLNCLGGILLRKLALLADAIEQFATGSELRDNVVFILMGFVSRLGLVARGIRWPRTLDSNQSQNRTICGCLRFCSISNSSYTMRSLPLTFFFKMILMATLPSGPSASLTMP
jgi:hypothetical protein